MWACGGDSPSPQPPQKTPEELAIEALTGTGTQAWAIAGGGSVTRSGTAVTDLYQNFELIMNSGSAKTYTTLNNNDLFDASGNWSFAGTNFDKFSLTGGKPAAGREISFTKTGDNLRLQFTIPAPGARINGVQAVAGSYVFNLVKK
ncbi:MAG: hypothetical protein HWE15_13645 [Algoriphagus sp.]|nr:hypothetical protein [Algoriphagus sp.]